MGAAQLGLEAAGELLVHQDGVEIHRRLGHAHALPTRRDAGMQVAESLAVIEPLGFGHEAFDQCEHAIGAIDEAFERGAPIGGALRAVFVEPGLGARGIVRRRQPQQRQEIAALEMRAFFLKLRAPLCVDQSRDRIGKFADRIAVGGHALRLDEHGPA